MDEPSPKPKKLWARFVAQETGLQKFLVAVAALITATATVAAAGVGAFQLVALLATGSPTASSDPTTSVKADGTSKPTSTVTTREGQVLVEQGSPEADDLVRAFVEADGARIQLDAMVLGQATDTDPQWIFHLWYNCQGLEPGQSPGEDRCDSAAFVFDDQNPSPPSYDRPDRVELTGAWADNRPSELGYGAKGLSIFPVRAS